MQVGGPLGQPGPGDRPAGLLGYPFRSTPGGVDGHALGPGPPGYRRSRPPASSSSRLGTAGTIEWRYRIQR